MTIPTSAFDNFTRQWAVLLTTYRRDGTPVGTAVNLAVDGDRAFFRTWDTTGKMKRIRNNPCPSASIGSNRPAARATSGRQRRRCPPGGSAMGAGG